jgi:hypothetical protein
MKIKMNLDEVKHVEAALSMFLLNEVEVLYSFSPPIQEVEEATSLGNEEFEDLVEAAPASTLPTHKKKRW